MHSREQYTASDRTIESGIFSPHRGHGGRLPSASRRAAYFTALPAVHEHDLEQYFARELEVFGISLPHCAQNRGSR
jgi:hypothetical protein